MPRALGRTHRTHKTPHVAIFTVGAINAALILAFWGLNRVIEWHGYRKAELPQIDSPRMKISTPPQSVGSITENTTRTLEQRSYDARSESQ